MVFPAAAKLFAGDYPGDGFQIPFQAPDCGTLQLSVEVDGPLTDYMQALDGSLGLVNGTYTASDGEMLNLGARLKAFNEMSFEGGVAYSQLEKDRLYGTKLKLTGVYTYPDGSTETRKQEIYLYRWLEVVAGQDASVATGRTAAFHEKEDWGLGKLTTTKQIDFHLPSSVTTTFEGSNPNINYGSSLQGKETAEWLLASAGAIPSPEKTDTVKLNVNGVSIGELIAAGKPPQVIPLKPNSDGTFTPASNPQDDDSLGPVTLEFLNGFKFFNKAYTKFYVNVNGNITFDKPYHEYPRLMPENDLFPIPTIPLAPRDPMIAPFWSDINPAIYNGALKIGDIRLTEGKEITNNPFVQVDWSKVTYYGVENDEPSIPKLVSERTNDFSLYMAEDASGGDWVAFAYRDMNWAKGGKEFSLDALLGFTNGSGESDFDTFNQVDLSFARPLDNKYFLYRIGADGKPELVAGFGGDRKFSEQFTFEEPFFVAPDTNDRLGIFYYIPTIYNVVQSYNTRLSNSFCTRDNNGIQRCRTSLPEEEKLDWKWVAAMIMTESNPTTALYQDLRKYDPIQFANEIDNDLLILANGDEFSYLITTPQLRTQLGKKTVTSFGSNGIPNYQAVPDDKRIDANLSIEGGVARLFHKKAIFDNGGNISGWKSWQDAIVNYNVGDSQYWNKVNKAYELLTKWLKEPILRNGINTVI